jgi:hypothetical protein
MEEEWRWVPGYESKYEVSNQGGVRSHITCRGTVRKKPRLVRPWTSNKGYPVVGLVGKRRFLVHRLVALTFIPNPKDAPCVNHKDSNRANSHANNLEWVTRSENQKHGYRFGSIRVPGYRGEKNAQSKLTEEQVLEIRHLYRWRSPDANQYVLAHRYNVHQSIIGDIVHRRTWTHI